MIHPYQISLMNFHRLSLLIEIRRPHLGQFPLKSLISSFILRNWSTLNFLWALELFKEFMQCKNVSIWKWRFVQSNGSFIFYVTWDMIRLHWKLRCRTHSSSMLVDGEAKSKLSYSTDGDGKFAWRKGSRWHLLKAKQKEHWTM